LQLANIIPKYPTMTENFTSRLPSEMRINKQWDFAIEQFLTKTSIGFFGAGLASIVLFSK